MIIKKLSLIINILTFIKTDLFQFKFFKFLQRIQLTVISIGSVNDLVQNRQQAMT